MSRNFISTKLVIIFALSTVLSLAASATAAPGDVDSAFVPAAFTHPTETARITAMAVQDDDKIIVGGIFNNVGGTGRNSIARLNRDGSLDTSFNPILQNNGSASPSVLAIAIQPDGKVLVGGAFNINGSFTILARFNPDGSLDPNFGVGIANQSVSAISVQPDGGIIVGGDFGLINNVACSNLARLNADGSLSAALGNAAGIVGPVEAMAVQTDGRIVIGGGFTIPSTGRARLTRLNPDGTQDVSFVVGTGANAEIFDLAVQPDGRILAGGSFTAVNGVGRNAIARINPNGSVDGGFTPTFFAGSIVYSLIAQPDGKVFIAGSFGVVNGSVRANFGRLNADGTNDSFYPTNPPGGASAKIWIAVRAPDNRFYIGGEFATVAGLARSRVARLEDLSPHRQFDFDGDGRADRSVFRASDRVWYVNGVRSGFFGIQWGLPTDKLVPADYDGDGRADLAIWREAPAFQAAFYILNSSNFTVRVDVFGQTGDIPVAGDFDGDGKSDPAVYRDAAQSVFYYRGSLNNPNGNITFLNWGTSGDVPVAADFDGDGLTDAAVFRPSTSVWSIRRSSDSAVQTAVFGLGSDRLVPGDFDGDAKADVAVVRNGVWYALRSATGTISASQWGTGTDAAAPADYDGDGRVDLGIYRGGEWWISRSGNGAVSIATFGLSSDVPIPTSFVR